MCKHHIKYEEKYTHVTQFQGQMYTIYLQAHMTCSCEQMIGPSTYGCYVKNEEYDTNIHKYQIVHFRIGHFTVMDGSEADGNLVLIQTFLLY